MLGALILVAVTDTLTMTMPCFEADSASRCVPSTRQEHGLRNLYVYRRYMDGSPALATQVLVSGLECQDYTLVLTSNDVPREFYVTVDDSSGNVSCPSNGVTKGAWPVSVPTPVSTEPARINYLPYRAPTGWVLYDLFGRRVVEAVRPGVYTLRSGTRNLRVVVLRP